MICSLEDIKIRTRLKPGDTSYVIWMHGHHYSREYGYGTGFENYVAAGLCEFHETFEPALDGVWIAEHKDKTAGFILLMHRGDEAQLRFFIVDPVFRGIGLGNLLMNKFMEHARSRSFKKAFLWTTTDLKVASGLYIKHGFTLVEEKRSSFFGKEVCEQKYERLI